MEAPEWREESDGTFIAETARFSLVVCRLADRRHARFLVMARRATSSDVLVKSGRTESVGQAMEGALAPASEDRVSVVINAKGERSMNAARVDGCWCGLSAS